MTSPLEREDMEALENSIASLRSLGGEEINLVLAELDRLRGKLEEITSGKTTLFLSDEDRALRVQDLCDASLAEWSRWVFLNMERVRERMQAQGKPAEDDADTMTVGALQGVIGLALLTFEAGNSHLCFETQGVTFGDQRLGDWQVDIKQVRKPDGSATGKGSVLAEVHSDDRRAEASFDVRPILLQIEYGHLLDLARCDWGTDQPADDVALMAEKYDPDVREVMEYVSKAAGGFECTVDGGAAIEWLKDNRPDAWGWLVAELEKEGKY